MGNRRLVSPYAQGIPAFAGMTGPRLRGTLTLKSLAIEWRKPRKV